MGPCEDQRLAEYEPDAIILWTDSHHQRHAVVVEFTLSIREDADTHHWKIVEKVQAYQTTVLHLQKLWGQSVKVSQQTYVMGCHWAILEKEWDDNLGFWGMNEAARYTIKKECMQECIK
eukprot:3810015-Rhodomonas_salina.1